MAADITRSEDQLYLTPENAVETATPEGIPVCDQSTRQTGRLSKYQRCASVDVDLSTCAEQVCLLALRFNALGCVMWRCASGLWTAGWLVM